MPTQGPDPSVDVLVISRLVLDELAGETPRVVLGGSGFWAAFGAALVGDRVELASKVGTDLAPYRDQLERLGVGQAALVVAGPTTSRTRITYPEPGVRHEVPLPDWDAHVRLRSMLADVPESLRRPAGVYVFRDLHPGFWPPLLDALEAPLMWEVPMTVCRPDLAAETRTILARTTILSINAAEAAAIFGPLDPAEAVRSLHALGPQVVLLRLGADGSVVSDGRQILHVAAAEVDVVDPTGAGNAYSGAFLAAWIERADLAAAATVATAAAACAVEQVGPPSDRATARTRVADLARTVHVTRGALA